ncbi:MAG: YjbQ family protein [Gemmatimonadetes bacterium]|nr:secondary thiamine-phosphate synthase enzyme YjbQ [Gemmatimonadota bacterium]NNM06040.1 YjbQ family protein [Gemmatimonadota bacterium]
MRFLEVKTTQRTEMVNIGRQVRDAVLASGLTEGAVHLWSMHTTCALTVNESADPDVARDMVWKMGELVPHHEGSYRHGEGNSDSHLKTSLFGPGLSLLIHRGDIILGTWQGIFLAEWDGPRTRSVALRISS